MGCMNLKRGGKISGNDEMEGGMWNEWLKETRGPIGGQELFRDSRDSLFEGSSTHVLNHQDFGQ